MENRKRVKIQMTKPVKLKPVCGDLCSVWDCIKPLKESGLCSMHTARLARTGRLTIKSIQEKIFENVVKENGCWIWQKYTNKLGYGRFRFKSKKELAHRVAYRVFNGLIPDGLLVLHKCDNPPCVNPGHLWLGTDASNVKDSISKGRTNPVARAKKRWQITPTWRKPGTGGKNNV